MQKKSCITMILLLLVSFLVSGCGSASKESVTTDTAYSTETSAGGWVEEEAVEEPMEEGETSEITENDLSSRKLIRTVDLSMETEKFDELKENIEKAISSFGGYTEYSNLHAPSWEGGRRYYSMTVRIPSEKLDSFIEYAGTLGTVTNKSEGVEDITLQYVDTKA